MSPSELRLVFVCAMWMTGFDVPSCSTLHLDKPMRNHTLMQTIAWANRAYPEKEAGPIVDYVGVFRDLVRALSIYGAGRGGGAAPVEDKAALIAGVRESRKEAGAFCRDQGVELDAIERVEGFRRLQLLADAVDALGATAEVKRRLLGLANDVDRLFKAALADVRAQEFRPRVKLLSVLAGRIRALEPPADISLTMKQVEALLDEQIETEGSVIGKGGRYSTDLSAIDFEELAEKFARSRKRTFKEKLTSLLVRRVERMVRENPTRIDYLEKLQARVDAYNAGSANVEEHVRRLFEFAEELNEEERRSLGQGLDREELAVFDTLTKPEMELTAAELKSVKSTAWELLDTLEAGKLTLGWRKRRQAQAEVRVTIEKHLDDGLPWSYTPELFRQQPSAVF